VGGRIVLERGVALVFPAVMLTQMMSAGAVGGGIRPRWPEL